MRNNQTRIAAKRAIPQRKQAEQPSPRLYHGQCARSSINTNKYTLAIRSPISMKKFFPKSSPQSSDCAGHGTSRQEIAQIELLYPTPLRQAFQDALQARSPRPLDSYPHNA